MSEHNPTNPDTLEEARQFRQAYQLFMRAPVAICMLRLPDFTIEMANPHMLRLWDRDPTAIGKKLTEVFTEIDVQGFSKMLQYVVSSGRAFHEHERPVTIIRNGERDLLYANFVFQPHFNDTGSITGILAVAHEVTAQVIARKKIAHAEETTRLAVDAAKLGSYELNLETNEVTTTPRFNQIFGLDRNEKRSTYKDRIHPDDREIYRHAFETSMESGYLGYEARVIWDDDTSHWIRVSGRVLYDITQKPLRVLGIVQDITDEKKFSENLNTLIAERTRELELANQQLARSNAELEQFAYVTSHDLQEPLRKIQMFSSLLLGKSGPKPDAPSYTRKIADSAKRMTSLITDLLDYSRLSKTEPEFGNIDLNRLVRSVLLDFEMVVERKKATVNTGNLAVVPGIAAQLNQLFYNLVGNALKFSDPGKSPVITIDGRKLPANEIAQL
ncbi:MAG: PAS domain S-box protein, partial [Sphingobacteriales bacterium]